MFSKVNLDRYLIIHEDLNVDTYDGRITYHYEYIRKLPSTYDLLSEYKVVVTRFISEDHSYVEVDVWYQTKGNGFVCWHTFKVRSVEPIMPEEFRMIADKYLTLYLSTRSE